MTLVSREIVLASASPRRAALLRAVGLDFTVAPSAIDEVALEGEAPRPMAERLARAKVSAARPLSSPSLAIAADTGGGVDGTRFGQPRDTAEAGGLGRVALKNSCFPTH